MSASIFSDKLPRPDEQMLIDKVGAGKIFIDKLVTAIRQEYGSCHPEWRYYGRNSGWILKLPANKRNVLFVIPCDGYIQTVVTLGDKAAETVMESALPDDIKLMLSQAPRHMEGKSVQIEIRNTVDFENLLDIIKMKLG